MTEIHTATISLTNEQIANQVIGAIEGGSGYWMKGFKLVSSEVTPSESPWYADPKLYGGEFKIAVEIYEDDPVEFTHESLKKGIQWLADNHSRRLNEILSETDDVETSDVFIQACALGEIVYG